MSLFPDCIGRLEFILRYVVLLVAGVGNMFLTRLADQSASPALRFLLYLTVVVLGIAILVAGCRSLLFPRLRDLGLTNIYALLIFVPFVNLAFLLGLAFAPSGAFIKSPQSD